MDSYPHAPRRVLYLVVCAAPPARSIGELVELMQRLTWTVCVIATPQAAGWIDVEALARQTSYPVRSNYKHPDDPDVLPLANAIAVVPATFNTINKWAAGISDTFALGILNEALGLGLPIVVTPYAKPPLAAHPAFARSLEFLRVGGVTLTPTEAIRPREPGEPFRWAAVVEALSSLVDDPDA
jgi:phosphopantothenoylcysteine synthetase/decarboxylase